MPRLYARCFFLLLGLFAFSGAMDAQNIRISQGGRVNSCSGTFFDSGGASGDHIGPGQMQEITLCPGGGGTGTHIELLFTQFDIDGTMVIFNGRDAMADTLTTLSGAVNGTAFRARATAANTSGCLTIRFTNDGMGTRAGWTASINCVVACQPIQAVLVSATPAPMPNIEGYIDVCPGDQIELTGRGIYPEDGIIYNQSDATSTFTWNFQDGTVETGRTVTHTYDEPGGFVVQLVIEDSRGCRNSNRISQRVRVAPPPIFGDPQNLPSSICAGESLPITLKNPGDNGSGVSFRPSSREFSFNTSQTFTELTFLPDGTGIEYSSPLLFSNFDPGQTLEQGADLVRICARMEHSYLGDLDIWIECPNGSRLDLHSFANGNGVSDQLLGRGDENTTTPDPPGTYCWTATAPRTITQAVNALNIGTDETLPEMDYAPEDNFSDLVGCELNGEWSLHIRDNLAVDNGYIYEWSIEFERDVYPDQETFSVPITQLNFQNDQSFGFYSQDSIELLSQNPGSRAVTIESLDEYGCAYDTTVLFNILPPFAPGCRNCGPLVSQTQFDTAICLGESFVPAVARTDLADTIIVWESNERSPFGNDLYPNVNQALETDIEVSFHSPATIDNATADIESVCIDLDNAGDLSDITLQLVAPNGRTLNLLENFGGNGEDLRQTCFSPTSTTSINSSTAPYTGNFQAASGGWTAFNTSTTNGRWRLRAWDGNGNDLGEFLNWTIGLRYDRDPVYTWAPADGTLSCTDCPDPTITPTAAGTYTLNVTTADGCTDQAVVNVSFNALDISVSEVIVSPSCPGQRGGSIDVTVTGTEPSYTYAWSDGPVTQDRMDLSAGSYTLTISDADGCRQEEVYTLTDPLLLELTTDEVTDVSCNNGSDGQILITTTGGTTPYTYQWNDPNVGNSEDAGSLTAGSYTLVVTDARSCTATVTELVDEPQPLMVNFRDYAVRCRDGDDGRAVAIASGGNGGYTYQWQTGATQDSISGLSSGPYGVTVTDQRGCSTSATVQIAQPTNALTATVAQDTRACFGTDTNVATVSPSGGTTPYTYAWSNGEVTATATALPVGAASVSVTDANGCEESFSLTLQQHPEVTANILATSPSCNNRTDGQLGAVPRGGVGMMDTDYTFQWSNNQTGIVITNLPGDVLYRLTITDPIGCTGEVERFLPAPPPITFNVIEDPVDCFGNSTGGLTIANISGPNTGNFDLQWGSEANFQTTPTISNLPAGTNYGLRITDIDGCTADTVLTISEPPVLMADISKLDVACFGEANGRVSVVGTGGVGGYQYAWSTNSNQNQIVGLVAGDYLLTLTDANGCEEITTTMVEEPAPVTITTAAEAALCEGEATGSITVTGGGGRPPFVYGLENRGFTRNNIFVGLPAEEYVAFVRDSAGCRASANVIVNDGPSFSLDLGPDTTIIFGDSLRVIPQVQGGVDTIFYFWKGSYAGTLSCPDCPSPTVKPEYEIDYFLTIMDGNGCEAEDRFRVSVRKIREVAVPTGFSPNGDARNDRLLVHGRPGTQVINFAVFDRWGNLLFEDGGYDVNDPTRGWDGTAKGDPVNAGVYFYRLVIRYDDDSEETLSGETSLIR